jgi:hypothetical protein
MEPNQLSNSDIISMVNNTISLANTFLVFGALIVAVITIGITVYFNHKAKDDINNAINNILLEISKDSNIQNKLISDILKNDELLKKIVGLQDFKEQLNLAVADQILLIKTYNTFEYTNLSEYENEDKLKDIDVIIDKEVNLSNIKETQYEST